MKNLTANAFSKHIFSYRLIAPINPKKDQGKRMAFVFDTGKVSNEKYGTAVLAGHFLCMSACGEYPHRVVDAPELFALIHEEEKVLEKHFLKWGLPDVLPWHTALFGAAFNLSPPSKMQELGSFAVCLLPDKPPKNLRTYLFSAVYTAYLVDIVTKVLLTDAASDKKTVRKKVMMAMEGFIAICYGKFATINDIPDVDFPYFKPLCQVLLAIRQLALLTGMDITYFMDSLVNFTRSYAYSCWGRFADPDAIQDIDEFIQARAIGMNSYMMLESINLARSFHISNEIRKDPLFQRYCDKVAAHAALINDVISVRRELTTGKLNNIFLLSRKYSLQESYNQMIHKVNELAIDCKATGLKLQACFEDDLTIKRFIKSSELMVDGVALWSLLSKRYGDKKFNFYSLEEINQEEIYTIYPNSFKL